MKKISWPLIDRIKKDGLIQHFTIEAIRASVLHGDINNANYLVTSTGISVKKCKLLINYFEKWGNLKFNPRKNSLGYFKNHDKENWENLCKEILAADPFFHEPKVNDLEPIVDADAEFRRVVERLNKVKNDPNRVLLHSVLLDKVNEAILGYGRSDEKEQGDRKGAALFDRSTTKTTLRATKYAKGI